MFVITRVSSGRCGAVSIDLDELITEHWGGCMEHVSYSPPFDGKVTELLARAEQGGVADVPPRDFDDNCS